VLEQRKFFCDEVKRVFLPWLTREKEAELAKASVPDAFKETTFELAATFVNNWCADMEFTTQT
jgi:hypothetical protein